MRKHLPSTQESIELLALGLMIGGLQWALHSWGWTAFFSLGFVWNWAVLNGWVMTKTQEKKYRFSVLRGVTIIHRFMLAPFEKFPRLRAWVEVLPAGLALGFVAYVFDAPVPWWAALLGSLAFLLVRRQITALRL